MNTEKWFKEKFQEFRDDADFYTEELILDLTEQIVAIMRNEGINRTELAKRLNVSKAFITKILNGNPNLTLRTMASLAKSLGCNINIDICPEGFEVLKMYRNSRKIFNPAQFTKEVEIKPQTKDGFYESAA